jgi:biotin carboxylase
VLVVGTTGDYIDLLCRRCPGRAVWLTDASVRAHAAYPKPDDAAEVLCDLTRPDEALTAVEDHLARWQRELTGIACYDCESMPLAAFLARSLSLSYPSPAAVAACRSKLVSKQLWRRAGLPCPEAACVESREQARGFLRRLGRPVVLKPLTGSGSELTFLCADEQACARAFELMETRLAAHDDVRMYASYAGSEGQTDPRRVFGIEEFVEGPEFSCDFLLDGDHVEIIRFARKIPADGQTFGTTLAYVVPGELPPEFDLAAFRRRLLTAAHALGLERALCMLDFIVRDGQALMIEMAPRPGGDCLPFLLQRSAGFDILGAELDVAEGRPVTVPASEQWQRLVGLRLFATRAGVIGQIDTAAIAADPRVCECSLKQGPGDTIVLPPDDYDSRVLGHVLFAPTSPGGLEAECLELFAKLTVEMDEA